MSAPVWHRFATLEDASVALAGFAASQLAKAITLRGEAVLAVPGGTTPGLFLRALASLPLDWRSITIMPTDERLVPADHPRSNRQMIGQALQPAVMQGARLIDLCGPSPDPDAALAHANRVLARLPPLDLLVSGMGADGHIASLFPGDLQILQSGPASAVLTTPQGLEPRLSLSVRHLTEARQAALLVTGADKRAVLDKIDAGTDPLNLPVTLLMQHEDEPLCIYWSPA